MSLFQKVTCFLCLFTWNLNPAFETSPRHSELWFYLMNAQRGLMGPTDRIEWEWSRQYWLIAVMDGVYLFYRGLFTYLFDSETSFSSFCLPPVMAALSFIVNTGKPSWTLMHLGFGVHVCIRVCICCKLSLPCAHTGLSHAWKGRNREGNVELCIATLSADKSVGLLLHTSVCLCLFCLSVVFLIQLSV